MVNIAILGFGIVGGGVAEVLTQNPAAEKAAGKKINIKYILDKREFPDSPWNDRVVHDMDIILNDPDVSIVAEMMGGSHPAYEFTAACLKAGKSVVTSNKEVVANFGAELLALAEENNASYLFEASVGGGIPIIRPLRTSQSCDDIVEIDGILNGTTNYILTKMGSDGVSFDDALQEARKLGYAEANPSADVDGIDTQRKICILSAIAFGKLVPKSKIYTETMRNITVFDMQAANKLGYAVKLIGRAVKNNTGAYIFVAPHFVPKTNPLAYICDVYNGIIVKSNVTGEVMYYGKGAGRYPTAGAVVSDIVNIASGAEAAIPVQKWNLSENGFMSDIETYSCNRYIKIKNSLYFSDIFGECDYKKTQSDEIEFISQKISESDYKAKIENLKKAEPSAEIISHIRVL